MSALLPLEEAQERLLALAPKVSRTPLALTANAPKRWLASDHTAQRTQPPADLSAMDGYAICGAGPWQKVGESRAGTPFDGALKPGECTRISTGAHMPQGSESVLIQENASLDGALVFANEVPPAGRHVRKAGFDFAAGDAVLPRGTMLNSATLALAVSAGLGTVEVGEAPSVAVLDSGDELVPAGEPCAPHQIPASNGAMLGAMLAPYVDSVEALGPVPDDRAALAKALERSEQCQILITSGGASVGDHDLIQQALIDWGAELDFWKVAIKPGKPLMVATRGEQVILGLPGNPVSSYVTAFLFALPLIRAAMGDPEPLPMAVTTRAGVALPAVGTRREFLRGVWDGKSAWLASSQDSSALQALANANCLIERREGSGAVEQGGEVSIHLLQSG